MNCLEKMLIGQTAKPLICTPVVGETQEKIMAQLAQILEKKPDIIEWRADFFEQIASTDAVVDVIEKIRKAVGDIPIIFTIRSSREGGQPISLQDAAAIELNAEVCRKTSVEYIDCELSNDPEHIRYLRGIATEYGKKIIGSFHNFTLTPGPEELARKFDQAAQYQLDVAKVAVMPQKLEDVLSLLSATLAAKQRLNIPLITMSMGKYGAISRMIGGVFGSSLTFAVGAKSSAPGQVPIADLRTALDIIDRSMGE